MVAYCWLAPAAALAAHGSGELSLAPPTFMAVSWLLGHTRAHPTLCAHGAPPFITFRGRIHRTPEGAVMLYPGDAGYDANDPGLAGPRHRILALPGGWKYQAEVAALRPWDTVKLCSALPTLRVLWTGAGTPRSESRALRLRPRGRRGRDRRSRDRGARCTRGSTSAPLCESFWRRPSVDITSYRRGSSCFRPSAIRRPSTHIKKAGIQRLRCSG